MRTETATDSDTEWTLLTSQVDESGLLPISNEPGSYCLTDRTYLRKLLESGVVVRSERGQRLTMADVDTGLLFPTVS